MKNISSCTWTPNADGTITVSCNCGDDAMNHRDTEGQDVSFTLRCYDVSQAVVDGKIAPEKTVR